MHLLITLFIASKINFQKSSSILIIVFVSLIYYVVIGLVLAFLVTYQNQDLIKRNYKKYVIISLAFFNPFTILFLTTIKNNNKKLLLTHKFYWLKASLNWTTIFLLINYVGYSIINLKDIFITIDDFFIWYLILMCIFFVYLPINWILILKIKLLVDNYLNKLIKLKYIFIVLSILTINLVGLLYLIYILIWSKKYKSD
ncbi:MAG: hypothetical protein E7Y34_02655 [Mycoplasma sp.]|nr:hypothetical protein [Mycoplasma sp.]